MLNLNQKQQAIVSNLVKLQSIEGNSFNKAYTSFIEDEINFTFEECEAICMYYEWA